MFLIHLAETRAGDRLNPKSCIVLSKKLGYISLSQRVKGGWMMRHVGGYDGGDGIGLPWLRDADGIRVCGTTYWKVLTDNNLADPGTKCIAGDLFLRHNVGFGVLFVPSSDRIKAEDFLKLTSGRCLEEVAICTAMFKATEAEVKIPLFSLSGFAQRLKVDVMAP